MSEYFSTGIRYHYPYRSAIVVPSTEDYVQYTSYTYTPTREYTWISPADFWLTYKDKKVLNKNTKTI